jgi:pantothenate kinase
MDEKTNQKQVTVANVEEKKESVLTISDTCYYSNKNFDIGGDYYKLLFDCFKRLSEKRKLEFSNELEQMYREVCHKFQPMIEEYEKICEKIEFMRQGFFEFWQKDIENFQNEQKKLTDEYRKRLKLLPKTYKKKKKYNA